MASITKDRVLKINEGCKNGFKLDIMFYVCYKEYNLQKYQKYEENKYNSFRLGYQTNYEYKISEYGSKYPVFDGTYNIVLNYNNSYQEGKMMISYGLGKDYILAKGLKKKTIKELQRYTEYLTDEALADIVAILEGSK